MGIIGGVKMTSLAILPDLLLMEAYEKAIDHDLDVQFIELLYVEMKKRGINNREVEVLLIE